MVHPAHIARNCAVLLGLLTAACAYPVNGRGDAVSIEDRFPITVEPQMATLRIPYDAARGDIDDSDQGVLTRFARDFLDRGTGAISISAPRRSSDVAGRVANRLVALGVPRNKLLVGGDTVNGPDDVKLSYIGFQAYTEPCGDWSMSLGYTSANLPPPNFGCATQHNLAAMVADPRDLLSPKEIGPDDAQRRLTVLDKYRKGEITGSTKSQEQSGAVSDIQTGSAK